MDANSKLLIQLLSCAIRKQKPDFLFYQDISKEAPHDTIDWKAIYKEALAHQVHTLLYPVISGLPAKVCDQAVRTGWQKGTLTAALKQLKQLGQIEKVLSEFNKAGIPVIALKGLVIRNNYPQPELRTMGDADLLVHKEDLPKVRDLFQRIGFEIKEDYYRHISFTHPDYPAIEVHWALSDSECKTNTSGFTEPVWSRTRVILIQGVPVLALSLEDQIIHLLFHTAHHMLSHGFGLRQLCDFVVFLEAYPHSINWTSIVTSLKEEHMDTYAQQIFFVCHKLFGLDLPDPFSMILETKTSDLLIEDILSAGVYGRKTPERETGNRIIKYLEPAALTSKKITSPLNLLHFLFPSPGKIDMKYRYAKKFTFLLPLAWLHRIVHNLKRIRFLKNLKSRKLEQLSKNRIKLLQWLELR